MKKSWLFFGVIVSLILAFVLVMIYFSYYSYFEPWWANVPLAILQGTVTAVAGVTVGWFVFWLNTRSKQTAIGTLAVTELLKIEAALSNAMDYYNEKNLQGFWLDVWGVDQPYGMLVLLRPQLGVIGAGALVSLSAVELGYERVLQDARTATELDKNRGRIKATGARGGMPEPSDEVIKRIERLIAQTRELCNDIPSGFKKSDWRSGDNKEGDNPK